MIPYHILNESGENMFNEDEKLNNYGREFNSQKRGGNSRFSVVIKKEKPAKPEREAVEQSREKNGSGAEEPDSERKRIYPFERTGAEDMQGRRGGKNHREHFDRRRKGASEYGKREGFSDRFKGREFSGKPRRGIKKESFEENYVFDEEHALLKMGEVGALRVKEITKIGAFLDIGLPKDMLLPFREQTYGPKPGDEVLVYIYTDKTGRPAATMRVYSHLSADSAYEKEDTVEGIIYEISEKLGAFVAVDDKYFGLIPPSELYGDYKLGDRVVCRVLEKREDGKLDLSPRKKAYQQMDVDAELIYEELCKAGGRLDYDDKTISANEVQSIYHMSKAQFKRGLGRLMKEKRAEKRDGAIIKLQ